MRKLETYDFEQQPTMHKIEYRVEETSTLKISGDIKGNYGIAVYQGDDKLYQVNDITINRKQLTSLTELCNQENLSLCHLDDVIEDFLNSLYGESF